MFFLLKKYTGRIFISILLLLIAFLGSVSISYAVKEYQVQQDEQKRKALYDMILDGASTSPVDLTISYTNPSATGSPLIFGGSHAPNVSQQDAWNKIAEVGITSIRKDFFIESPLPQNISLEDYKNNVNNIQDPANWNWNELNKIQDIFKNAHQRGMKTIGIVDYVPKWLTYSQTSNGVPKDWDVYEDIVKKTYSIYRNNVDYVEIWNEPNWNYFFHIEKSDMTVPQAYREVFYHAAKAIRAVDTEANDGKYVPIGGPAGYDPIHTDVLEALVDNERTKNLLGFVSYHNYESKHLKEPSWVNYKKILEKYGKADLPIFITEWNYEPESAIKSPYNTSYLAIEFTGNKFINYLKMGVAGANYHVIEPLNLAKPDKGEGYMGFYRFENDQAELLPQSRTWRLLSSKIGLGKGKSTIYNVEGVPNQLNTIGFINSSGQRGIAIVNNKDAQIVAVHLKDTQMDGYAKATVYYASAGNEAKTPVYEGNIKADKGTIDFVFFLPQEAVIGMVFSEEKEWFDLLPILNGK